MPNRSADDFTTIKENLERIKKEKEQQYSIPVDDAAQEKIQEPNEDWMYCAKYPIIDFSIGDILIDSSNENNPVRYIKDKLGWKPISDITIEWEQKNGLYYARGNPPSRVLP